MGVKLLWNYSNHLINHLIPTKIVFIAPYGIQADDPTNRNGLLCEECKMVMGEAKTLLEDKAIQVCPNSLSTTNPNTAFPTPAKN